MAARRAWAGSIGLSAVLVVLTVAPTAQLPLATGWVGPAVSVLAAMAVAAAGQLRSAAAALALPVRPPLPPRPASRPVHGRQCDPTTPGRPRPRAPGRRAPRAA